MFRNYLKCKFMLKDLILPSVLLLYYMDQMKRSMPGELVYSNMDWQSVDADLIIRHTAITKVPVCLI